MRSSDALSALVSAKCNKVTVIQGQIVAESIFQILIAFLVFVYVEGGACQPTFPHPVCAEVVKEISAVFSKSPFQIRVGVRVICRVKYGGIVNSLVLIALCRFG